MSVVATTIVVEINSAATAGNVNGGGFNPANANMMTDLTTDTNTGNTAAPVVSSATYTFVASDVGHWLYLKSGTNWTPGWYKIQSVAGGKATLEAAIGSANVRQVVNNKYGSNTVVGCATVASPTGGTFTIDYSQGTATIQGFTNLGSASGSTTLTDNSSAGLMRKTFAGNVICISAGTNATVGWYEIVSVTNTNSVVLDVTPHGANTMSATTGKVGGAISLGGSTTGIDDNDVFTKLVASGTTSTRFFIKGNTTYTPAVAVTTTGGANAWPVLIEGYATSRGDRPLGSTRPIIACGANVFSGGANTQLAHLIGTGTGTAVFSLTGTTNNDLIFGCKVVNSSTTAGRAAIKALKAISCEVISYRGIGIQCLASDKTFTALFNYVHDCNVGMTNDTTASGGVICDNIIEGCVTHSLDLSTVANPKFVIIRNTIYGAENKLGTGINFVASANNVVMFDNNFSGLATAVSHPTANSSVYCDYNNYFNNTANINTVGNLQFGAHDAAANPTFTTVAQLTGTTATTSGSVLTQGGGDFSTVTDGVDFLYLKSGTGITAGVYGIVSHTATTLTLDIAPGTSAVADKSWQITTGHNFAIGTNLKGLGYPGDFPAALSTGSSDIGAVSRLEAGMIRARSFGGM